MNQLGTSKTLKPSHAYVSFTCSLFALFSVCNAQHFFTLCRLSNSSGKAAGIDGIPAEFYKSNRNMAAEVLQPILEEAWLSEAFPEEWTDGIIVKMPKKGNRKIYEEYVSCPQSPKSSPRSYWIG